MRTILLAAGSALAALSTAGTAQGEAPPGTPGQTAASCYIEIQRLFAERPAGIGDLGAAIRELDTRLRPQVEEINRLKQQIARLEDRQVSELPLSVDAALEDEDEAPRATPVADDATAEAIRRVQAELEARQAQLRLDYKAQQKAIVGPVQTRISQKAQAFAAERGCAQLKIARTADLETLRTAAARDVTGDFVAWYLASPPA